MKEIWTHNTIPNTEIRLVKRYQLVCQRSSFYTIFHESFCNYHNQLLLMHLQSSNKIAIGVWNNSLTVILGIPHLDTDTAQTHTQAPWSYPWWEVNITDGYRYSSIKHTSQPGWWLINHLLLLELSLMKIGGTIRQ